MKSGDATKFKNFVSKDAPERKGATGSQRRRKTEKEEDDEMLQTEVADNQMSPFKFEESPECTCS